MNGPGNGPMTDEGALAVRSIEGMGRGVFASVPIAKGATVLSNYTIPVSRADKERAEKTVFKNYCSIAEDPADNEAVAYLAIGLGSLVNNSAKSPNVEQQWQMTEAGWVVEFVALRDIDAGEQLLFDYGFKENEVPRWAEEHEA